MRTHTIWSNINLDIEDWRDAYKEFLEMNEMDDDPNDEDALYDWMVEMNDNYLDDERMNLDIEVSHDNSFAKVIYSVLGSPEQVEKDKEVIEKNTGRIRYKIIIKTNNTVYTLALMRSHI